MHNYYADISALAERAAPNEICGFLHFDGKGSLRFDYARNLLKDESFLVDPVDTLAALNSPSLAAFVHSHCQHDATFSPQDLDCLERTKLPWMLYSVASHTFNFRRPLGATPPLQGRVFAMGIQDCVGLVTDYYFEFFGLRFPYFTRTAITLNVGYTLDNVTLYNLGFEQVAGEPTTHDLLLMRYRAFGPATHVAVMPRPGLILHQELGKVSALETYTELHQKLTVAKFRHPKFTSKSPTL